MTEAAIRPLAWTKPERSRLLVVLSGIVALHIAGWTLYLWQAHSLPAAGSFAGAGTLAYVLGMRHAFDADHIAAIDDTTRLMMLRGRRPVGVGFFFALGHSSVVLILAVVAAVASSAMTGGGLNGVREVGGVVSVLVAISFLVLVAVLNAVVLRGLVGLWRRYRSGSLDEKEIDTLLLSRGLVNRVLGGRARTLIRSSWHMAPLGFLFGLGLETASEVTLLTLTASTASGGTLPLLAVISLPLLFAAGMSMLDTADSLVMSRAYAWAQGDPGRRLYYNVTTTAVTVAVGFFVALVYLCGFLADRAPDSPHVVLRAMSAVGGLAEHFELFGYSIAAVFVLAWVSAAVVWRTRFRDQVVASS